MTSASARPPWEELSEHFSQLLSLPAAGRPAFLSQLAADRPELMAELASMLAMADDSKALDLEALFGVETEIRDLESVHGMPRAAAVGDSFGPYRLLKWVARGGMGEVFLAERADGLFDQRVAVKVMRPGLDTVDLVSRFELERDLLARLTHPSVVPLLDGGTTAEGKPYLVLQYVEGLPITQHCVARALDRRARMRVFYRLCQAVHYAHSHLVVHRDLKPSNILVTPEGEIRLLDFGIAKLLAGDRPESRRRGGEMTRAELVPMTPERAAPEQKRLEPISTATDVWALGLLLHELLTDALPFADECGEPQLTGLGAKLGDRDLAALVAKALRLEAERRYVTAGELAEDVERWLGREPVKARPDSLGYRLNRFVARHRGAVTVGTAAMAALLLLALFSAWQSWRTAQALGRAASEQEKAAAVLAVMVELLGTADPTSAQGGPSPGGDRLLAQAEERAQRMGDQPEVQARLRQTAGHIYLNRGDVARAAPLLALALAAERQRLAPEDEALLELRLENARAFHLQGASVEARREYQAVVEAVEGSSSPNPALLVGALLGLGSISSDEEGETLVLRALALQRSTAHPDPLAIGGTLTVLATRKLMGGDKEAARRLFQESLDLQQPLLGEEHPFVLSTRSNLASLAPSLGERAEEHRRILASQERVLGSNSQAVARSAANLGLTLAELGDWEGARVAFAHSLSVWQRAVDAKHSRIFVTRRYLAWALERGGQRELALGEYQRLVQELEGAAIEPRTAAAYRAELGIALLRAGRMELAERVGIEILATLEATKTVAPRARSLAEMTVGLALLQRGRVQEAVGHLSQAVTAAEEPKAFPKDAIEPALLRAALGRALVAAGESQRGRRLLEQVVPALEASWLIFPADLEAARDTLSKTRQGG